jgi:lysine 2,3-aminomutase
MAPGRRRAAAWKVELRRAIRTVEALDARLHLTDDERKGAHRAERAGLPLSITPYYLSLADPADPACPIRRQCVPRIDEAHESAGDRADPLGERVHEVAPGLVRRYDDRALLVVSDRCAVYCRFCTRSRLVGQGGGVRSMRELGPAFAWLRAHAEVREVIVSGGDPLVMATERLVSIVRRIRDIPSIEVIRLATRTPATLPSRIDGELLRALAPLHPLWIMTHFNHPKELTHEASRACRRLVDSGFPVMNQTVLLRGVNDDAGILESLFRKLVSWRVRPYYLLQADPVRGTSHLRTPLGVGIEIMARLQGRLSGIALPKLIVDTPGGLGKVPVGPEYVVSRCGGHTVLRTHRGALASYHDPP